jgi:hypothetical protein
MMNTENTFLRFIDRDNDVRYFTVDSILTIGIPWDFDNKEPFKIADDKFYQYVDTDRGWCFQPI